MKQNEQQPRGIISNGSYLLRVSPLTSALSFHRTRLCLFWQGPRSASGRARATRQNSSFLCSVRKRGCKRSLSRRKRARSISIPRSASPSLVIGLALPRQTTCLGSRSAKYSPHDLRHSYASRALALGESLTMIGKLLGHTQVQTTARYAHLARDSIQTAAARITGSIGGNLDTGDHRISHDVKK